MTRPIERQEAILALLAEVWSMPQNQDIRLGQLLENCRIGWYTEDLNDVIYRLCEFGNIPTYKWVMWWTRGKDWKSPLVYKQLTSLETSHLEELLKLPNCSSKKEIRIILNKRGIWAEALRNSLDGDDDVNQTANGKDKWVGVWEGTIIT